MAIEAVSWILEQLHHAGGELQLPQEDFQYFAQFTAIAKRGAAAIIQHKNIKKLGAEPALDFDTQRVRFAQSNR